MPQAHYFNTDPAVPSRPSAVELVLPDFRAVLQTDRGVFAAGAVDSGTLELLRAAPVTPTVEGAVLDLGCGYGPIACALAHRAPSAEVWAIDINTRALDLTARNAAALGLEGVRAARPEDVPPDLRFAGIWSNPPIRSGKAALHDLLGTWLRRLEDGASAWLVVQKHLGADSLAAWLTDAGWAVTRVASRKGFRVLQASRR
jgi:16S rRNA (guanine1207-N2)-methyltransferase